MSQLLVTLPPPSSAQTPQAELAYCMLTSSDALTHQGHAAPALLPRADSCTLIMPAQALSWHRVELPKLPRGISAQKMQAVLAGLLEEQLLDEPSTLHLSLVNLPGSDARWVAACDKAWLTQSLAVLQQAGVQPSRIVPQACPLLGGQVKLHVAGQHASQAQLVVSDGQGVLSWPLSQVGALDLPMDAEFSAEPAVAATAEAVLQRRAQVMQASLVAMQSVMQAKALGLDLAQGEFALTGSGARLQSLSEVLRQLVFAPAWGAARWAIALLLLANVLGLNLWAWQQNRQVQAQRDQMRQLLTSSFPNVKVVVDAPLQMQREISALRQSQGQLSGRDFESIYSRFSTLAGMNTAPSAIEYIADEVSVRGSGMSADQLQALAPKLQSAQLAVRSDAQRLIISHRESGEILAQTGSAR